MAFQHTIKKAAAVKGTGLHSGEKASAVLLPASGDTGVVFVRTDIEGSPEIPADIAHLVDPSISPQRTSVAEGKARVDTIEHVMAVLHIAGIDSIRIEVNGPEMPGLDGSALGFAEVISASGISPLKAERRVWKIGREMRCVSGGAEIRAFPDDRFSISYIAEFDGNIPPDQRAEFELADDGDISESGREIASSRTFCSEKDARIALARGLGKGATTQNTLVFNENGIIDNSLRFDNECARHKVLDLLGDLFLLGGRVTGRIEAVRSGHALNYKLLHEIIK